MNSFIYHIPTKVYFGENQLGNLGAELKQYGNRVLLVYGGGSIKKIGLYDKIVTEIKNSGLELFELSGIDPNPRIDSVRQGAQLCQAEKSMFCWLWAVALLSMPRNIWRRVLAWSMILGIFLLKMYQ